MEIKIRYTFKRKADGHIWQEIKGITSIEVGFPISIILNDNELLGRDLWTGYEDFYGSDIVRIPNYETTWKHKEPDFDWRVFEIKMNQYTWSLTNNAIYMPFKTYDAIGLPYEFEKIGDIYNNPELIEK